MLSSKVNARKRWKTTIGLTSKKSNFARAAYFFCTFLCHCFARLQCEISRNFLVTHFFGGNVMCSRSLFFTAAHFHLALVAASISHFLIAAKKFSCCSSNKKMSPLFFFSLSFTGLLSFSCSTCIFQICAHDNLLI